MIYVRWKRGESRRGAVFPAVSPDHFLWNEPCVQCSHLLGNGEEIQLVAVGPVDDDERERHNADRWYNAGAVALHRRDVDTMSDAELDALCAELVPRDTV